jgi:hypothetical protein
MTIGVGAAASSVARDTGAASTAGDAAAAKPAPSAAAAARGGLINTRRNTAFEGAAARLGAPAALREVLDWSMVKCTFTKVL